MLQGQHPHHLCHSSALARLRWQLTQLSLGADSSTLTRMRELPVMEQLEQVQMTERRRCEVHRALKL